MAASKAKGAKSGNFVSVWSTETLPADNSSDDLQVKDVGKDDMEQGVVFRGGSVFRIVEIPPGTSSPMHRSHTVDYGLLLTGECDLMLDSGEVRHLRAGDVVIQRGTNHAWINRADVPCRWAWVLVSAAPVEIGGQALPTEWGEAPDVA